MAPFDRSPRPSSLLAELTRLHDTLAEPDTNDSAIPLLQDIVEPAIPARPNTEHLHPMLMQSAEQLLQEVLHDFTPQITAELEKRLQQHLEKLIREQEQLHLSSQFNNRPQP